MRIVIKNITVLLISIFIGILFFFNIKINGPIIKIFNCSFLVVSSGSMFPELAIGDVIIIKECEDYKVGDVITYNVDNDYLITHRIIERNGDNFITKGDNNNIKDSDFVNKRNIEGKVIFNSKLLRLIYNYWFVSILVIFIILIVI